MNPGNVVGMAFQAFKHYMFGSRIAGGHKANLNNPNTSEGSKQHSKEILDQEFDGGKVESSGDKNPQNVAGGLKAYVVSIQSIRLRACVESR